MFLTNDERTGVLLEVIQDVDKSIGDLDEIKMTEAKAHRLLVGILMILKCAERHPLWPKKPNHPDPMSVDPLHPDPVVIAPPPTEGVPF